MKTISPNWKNWIQEDYLRINDSSFALVYKFTTTDFLLLDEEKQDQLILSLAKIFQTFSTKIQLIKLNTVSSFEKQLSFLNNLPKNSLVQNFLKTTSEVKNTSLPTYYFFFYFSAQQELENFKTTFTSPFNLELQTQQKLYKLLPRIFQFKHYLYFFKSYFQDAFKFHKVLTIQKYPFHVNNGWFSDVFNFPNCSISININSIDFLEAKDRLNRNVAVLKVNFDDEINPTEQEEVRNNMASVENLIETISNSDEVIKNITINILISATSLEELRKVENEFKMLCLKHNFDYSENLFQQQEALFDYFPSTFSFSSNQQIISSTSVAASYPFFLQNITDPNGIIIGKTHKGFFFFNLFHQDDTRPNSNMFIIGKSGYGKSFTSRKIIYQELIKGTKVFILDPEREYINIPKTFKNSTVLDVGDGSQLTINPLQFFTVSSSFENQIADHLSFLESFFSILLPELDYLNIRLLMDCFLKFYQQWFQKHKTSPIIKDFIKFLKTKKHKTLLLSFSVFQQGYKENELWNKQSSFNFDKQITIFNFNKLFSLNKRLVSAQIFLTFHLIENQIRENRIRNLEAKSQQKVLFFLDEAHLLIDKHHPQPLLFLFQLTKRIRKYQGSVIITTQNINDFIGDASIKKYSEGIMNNCQYSIFLHLSSKDVLDLSKILKANPLSETEMQILPQLERGTCLFNLSANNRFYLKILA